jgi:hypothetical protein
MNFLSSTFSAASNFMGLSEPVKQDKTLVDGNDEFLIMDDEKPTTHLQDAVNLTSAALHVGASSVAFCVARYNFDVKSGKFSHFSRHTCEEITKLIVLIQNDVSRQTILKQMHLVKKSIINDCDEFILLQKSIVFKVLRKLQNVSISDELDLIEVLKTSSMKKCSKHLYYNYNSGSLEWDNSC